MIPAQSPRPPRRRVGDVGDLAFQEPLDERLRAFNQRWSGKARIASVEFPPLSIPQIAKLRGTVPDGVEMFGLGDGFRVGFGYDIEHTMKGLELASTAFAR